RITYLLLMAWVAVCAAGCASAPSRFYTLNPTARADGSPAASYSVAVGPVTIPAMVDRPQFTVQVGPNRVLVEEFDRWAAPLNDNIGNVVAANLSVLLGSPHVAAGQLTDFSPAYRVTINVQRFESKRSETMKNEGVLIEALWVVHRMNGGAT